MIINIGLIVSESQITVKSLDTEQNSIESISLSFSELAKQDMNLLFFQNIEEMDSIAQLLKSEENLYPIVDISSVEIEKSEFENLNYNDLFSAFEKINTRWILSNNIQTIEELCSKSKTLKNLWIKDRNEFFKSLWTSFKMNLAATELTILFHDLKEPTAAGKEKGEKPTLCTSYIKGSKLAEIYPGEETQTALMKEYEKEFTEAFNITEYDATKGQLVICSHLEKSPILFMATVPTLNQLQRSVLIGLMNGLQAV